MKIEVIRSLGAAVVLSSAALASAGPDPAAVAAAEGSNYATNAKCVTMANAQLMDVNYGMDPDGNAAYISADGKTVIAKPGRIVKRTVIDGVETITYKTSQPKMTAGVSRQTMELETVERTVVIRRDSSGRLLGVTKQFDLALQEKVAAEWVKQGVPPGPLVKSINSNFVYDGDNCAIEQNIGIELENAKSKEEKKVYYDKKLCDQLAPALKQIGAQNAAQCSGLISGAQAAIDNRDAELRAEGKSFKQFGFFGQLPSKDRNYANNFNVGNAIQACIIGENIGFGAGFGYGGGVGQVPGGNSAAGKPQRTEKKKSSQ